MNKAELEQQNKMLKVEFTRVARERNMWKSDFDYLQSCVQSMTFWKRLRYLFTNKLN